MAKRQSSLGRISLVFAGISVVFFILHYANVVLVLNTVAAPLLGLLGTLLGVLGYFERDKHKVPAFVGMLVNAAILIVWLVLLLVSLL
jgi:hypothetical protein